MRDTAVSKGDRSKGADTHSACEWFPQMVYSKYRNLKERRKVRDMLDKNDIKLMREMIEETTRKTVREEFVPIKEEMREIREEQKAIREEQKAIREEQTAIREEQKAIREEQKAIREEQKTIREEQKSFREEQREIRKELVRIREDMERLENSLLDEIARTQTYLERKIEELKKKVDEMDQYYRIRHLEDENVTILLKMCENLQRRLERVESRIA